MSKSTGRKGKFSESQKQEMRQLVSDGWAFSYIARRYHCNVNAVYNNTFDVLPPVVLSDGKEKWARKASKIKICDVRRVRKMLKKNPSLSARFVMRHLGVSESSALSLIKGRTFRWVGGWTRPHYKKPLVYLEPIEASGIGILSDRRPGPKFGMRDKAPYGSVKAEAERLGVSRSLISRRRKGYRR